MLTQCKNFVAAVCHIKNWDGAGAIPFTQVSNYVGLD